MGIDKLKRVVWRLREEQAIKEKRRVVTERQLIRAIEVEVGTDPRTVKSAKAKLIDLRMIRGIFANGRTYELLE